jgi:hypothetical protein
MSDDSSQFLSHYSSIEKDTLALSEDINPDRSKPLRRYSPPISHDGLSFLDSENIIMQLRTKYENEPSFLTKQL